METNMTDIFQPTPFNLETGEQRPKRGPRKGKAAKPPKAPKVRKQRQPKTVVPWCRGAVAR